MKNYTDLEQSKRLANILALESADMYYTPSLIKGHTNYFPHLKSRFPIDWDIEQAIPCWSLATLLSVIPNYKLNSEHNYHTCTSETSFGKESVGWYDNPIDACVEMILKLHELNLL